MEARVVSALQASKVHKERTGKALKITEDIVKAEEMYEEEDHVPPHLRTLHQNVPPRFAAYLQIQSQLRDFDGHGQFPTVGALSDREADINRQFAEAFGSVGRPALGFPSPAPLHPQQQQQQQQTSPMSPHTPAFSPMGPFSPMAVAHSPMTMAATSPMGTDMSSVARSPMQSPAGVNFPRFEDNTAMPPPTGDGRRSRSNSMFQLPMHLYQSTEQSTQNPQAAMLRAMSQSQSEAAQSIPSRGYRRSRDESDGVKPQPAKRTKSIGEALSPSSGQEQSPNDSWTPFTMNLSPNAKDLFRIVQQKPPTIFDSSELKWADDDMDRMFEQPPPPPVMSTPVKKENEIPGTAVADCHEDEDDSTTTATNTNTESESRVGSNPPLSSHADEELFSPAESFTDFLRHDGYLGADGLGDEYWGSEFLNLE